MKQRKYPQGRLPCGTNTPIMLRDITLGLSVLILCAPGATAQTLTTVGNVPMVGTSFPMWSGAFTDPGPAGAGQTWNFSALTTGTGVIYDCIDPATSVHASLFPTAAYAITNSVSDTLFYTTTANGIELVGEDITYVAFDVQAPYGDQLLTLKLPATMGTNWTDNLASNYVIDGIGPTTRTGVIVGNADASGVIQMPYGDVYGTLRVHTRLQQADDAGVSQATRNRDEWAWYNEWSKFPLVRIWADTINITFPGVTQVVRTTEWLDVSVAGLHAPASNAFGLEVFPNPANDMVTLTFGAFEREGMTLSVSDALGRSVIHNQLGTLSTGFHRHEMALGELPPGCYSVLLMDATGARSVVRLVRE